MRNSATLEQARAAKTRVLDALRSEESVVGVGITRLGEGYAVKVNLREPTHQTAAVPEQVDGVPVQVEVVGSLSKR